MENMECASEYSANHLIHQMQIKVLLGLHHFRDTLTNFELLAVMDINTRPV